jgi:hypothetical protein
MFKFCFPRIWPFLLSWVLVCLCGKPQPRSLLRQWLPNYFNTKSCVFAEQMVCFLLSFDHHEAQNLVYELPLCNCTKQKQKYTSFHRMYFQCNSSWSHFSTQASYFHDPDLYLLLDHIWFTDYLKHFWNKIGYKLKIINNREKIDNRKKAR